MSKGLTVRLKETPFCALVPCVISLRRTLDCELSNSREKINKNIYENCVAASAPIVNIQVSKYHTNIGLKQFITKCKQEEAYFHLEYDFLIPPRAARPRIDENTRL